MSERSIFGDLADHPTFVTTLERSLEALERLGTRAALREGLATGRTLVA